MITIPRIFWAFICALKRSAVCQSLGGVLRREPLCRIQNTAPAMWPDNSFPGLMPMLLEDCEVVPGAERPLREMALNGRRESKRRANHRCMFSLVFSQAAGRANRLSLGRVVIVDFPLDSFMQAGESPVISRCERPRATNDR